jgi:DNA-binding CsgD family transcriptional regulator
MGVRTKVSRRGTAPTHAVLGEEPDGAAGAAGTQRSGGLMSAPKAPESEADLRAPRGGPGPLSKREREALELLADGLSGAEIADRLVLSPETVRCHIRNAMAKLGASTRPQAIAISLHRHEIGESVGEVEAPPRAPKRTALRRQPHGLDAALTEVLEGVVGLCDVDAGSIFLTDEDGLTLRRVAHIGYGSPNADPPENLALGEGTLGRAALERHSQIVADPSTPGGNGMIVVPMLGAGRVVGVLCLTTRSSRPTGRQELLLLQALTGRLAELIDAGGERAPERLHTALERFRASRAAATRTSPASISSSGSSR